MNMHDLSRNEKIELFMGLFSGLRCAYGTYSAETGRTYQVKSMVRKSTISSHLWGTRPYGVYLLVADKTRAAAIDFDTRELEPVVKFITQTDRLEIPAYIERSKSKGHHVWMFFEHPVPACKARAVVHHILDKTGFGDTEVFPKRDRLGENVSYGNFINTPLFNLAVKKQKTVFVNPVNGYRPFRDQWKLLYNAKKISEEKLDDLIDRLNLDAAEIAYSGKTVNQGRCRRYKLPACKQKMLEQGVTQFQRVSCFRLAVSLKCAGVPFDQAVETLKTWSLKNRPRSGKRVITEKEIFSQARYAYQGGYTSIGCECPSVMPFCEPDCPIRKKNHNRQGG
jgi:hypothetical protein